MIADKHPDDNSSAAPPETLPNDNDNTEEQKLYTAIKNNDTITALKLLEDDNDTLFQKHSAPIWTVFHWAAYNGNEKIIESLLSQNAASLYHTHKTKNRLRGITTPDPVTMNTPLHRAAQRGHLGVVWLLLLSSFSTDDVDDFGNTPLHLAAANGHDDVVTCLLDDGADPRVENRFRLAPREVASTEECRNLLSSSSSLRRSGPPKDVGVAVAKGEGTTTAAETRRRHLETYGIVEGGIRRATEGHAEIETLKRSLEHGKEVGIVSEILDRGYRRVAFLELAERLRRDVADLKENRPVTTPTKYRLVRTLQNTLTTAERNLAAAAAAADGAAFDDRRTDNDNNNDTDATDDPDLAPLITEGRSLCNASHHDYWLRTAVTRLSRVPCANETTEPDMARLSSTLTRAEAVPGCDDEILVAARALHARLSSETALAAARGTLPKVKLPVEEMTPKEAKEYWSEEDRGEIEKTEGFPLPPEETGEYVWVPSLVLSRLREAVEAVEEALGRAEESGANEELISECKEITEKKKEEREILKVKDEEDRQVAIAEATKMAKKLKKKKKKKGAK